MLAHRRWTAFRRQRTGGRLLAFCELFEPSRHPPLGQPLQRVRLASAGTFRRRARPLSCSSRLPPLTDAKVWKPSLQSMVAGSRRRRVHWRCPLTPHAWMPRTTRRIELRHPEPSGGHSPASPGRNVAVRASVDLRRGSPDFELKSRDLECALLTRIGRQSLARLVSLARTVLDCRSGARGSVEAQARASESYST